MMDWVCFGKGCENGVGCVETFRKCDHVSLQRPKIEAYAIPSNKRVEDSITNISCNEMPMVDDRIICRTVATRLVNCQRQFINDLMSTETGNINALQLPPCKVEILQRLDLRSIVLKMQFYFS